MRSLVQIFYEKYQVFNWILKHLTSIDCLECVFISFGIQKREKSGSFFFRFCDRAV